MKTTFLKNSKGEKVQETSYRKPVRIIKGLEHLNLGFIVHNISYGTEVYLDIVDTTEPDVCETANINIVKRFWGAQLKDLTTQTDYGKEIIDFIRNYKGE